MLRQHGITLASIEAAQDSVPGVSWARVVLQVGGRFAFAAPGDEGEEALILVAHERGYAIDLVAVPAARPETWHRYFGLGFALGADRMTRAAYLGRSVTMHRNPLQWLKRGGQGACLLLSLDDVPEALDALPEKIVVMADDAAYGAALQAAMTVRFGEIRLAANG